MKKLLFLIPFLLIACAGVVEYNVPEIDPNLCMEYPVEKSLIRRVAAEYKIELNQIYYAMIDSASIGLIADALEKEDIRDYITDVRLFIQSRPQISYTYLISFMTNQEQWGDKWPLIEGILYRRITIFNSSMIISQHDRCLLLAGLDGAQRDLFL